MLAYRLCLKKRAEQNDQVSLLLEFSSLTGHTVLLDGGPSGTKLNFFGFKLSTNPRWLFLIEGVLTIGIACVFGLVLPSSPRKTKMLNEVERASVLYHFEMDECTVDDAEKVGSWEGVVMAVRTSYIMIVHKQALLRRMSIQVTDLKSWLFVGILSITYVSGAVVQFFPRCATSYICSIQRS